MTDQRCPECGEGPDEHPLVCACGRGCGTLVMTCEQCLAKPVNWGAMTPREMFEALVAAPKNVAGPWQPMTCLRDTVARETVSGQTVVWEREGMVVIHDWVLPYAERQRVAFSTRAQADARLRQLGWLLVDDEKGTP